VKFLLCLCETETTEWNCRHATPATREAYLSYFIDQDSEYETSLA